MCLHEIEEWNILAWEMQFFENPPHVFVEALRTFLVFASVMSVAFTAAMCRIRDLRVTAHLSILSFGLFMVGNSMQHLYWSFLSQGYAPGSVASGLVCLPAMACVIWHALRNHLIGPKPVIGLGCIWAIMLVGIVRMGNTLPTAILRLHDLGSRFATALGLEQ